VAELIRLDGTDAAGEVVSERLAAGASIAQATAAALEAGWVPLAQRAAALVAAGVTDAPEVFRVLGHAPQAGCRLINPTRERGSSERH
jgi:hypothetical protein